MQENRVNNVYNEVSSFIVLTCFSDRSFSRRLGRNLPTEGVVLSWIVFYSFAAVESSPVRVAFTFTAMKVEIRYLTGQQLQCRIYPYRCFITQ
jgi:hypothetical protein